MNKLDRVRVKQPMKIKAKGDKWKPNAIVRKAKSGIPTVIEINNMLYTLAPSQENTQAANEHREHFRKKGDL